MSREISTDFKSLTEFIAKYSLGKHITNPDYLKIISIQHKRYFSYLTCIAELKHLSASNNNLGPTISETQIAYLTESCSDIGNAFFVMLHGAYKPSRLIIRSSIETFIKGFTLDDYPGIIIEKSLYKIFDNVKTLTFFQDDIPKKIFGDIHRKYITLCLDTHTATELNMQHLTALNYFPEFKIDDAEFISKLVSQLVTSYITLICLKYNSYYIKMHHKSKENIIDNIDKNLRPIINGIVS